MRVRLSTAKMDMARFPNFSTVWVFTIRLPSLMRHAHPSAHSKNSTKVIRYFVGDLQLHGYSSDTAMLGLEDLSLWERRLVIKSLFGRWLVLFYSLFGGGESVLLVRSMEGTPFLESLTSFVLLHFEVLLCPVDLPSRRTQRGPFSSTSCRSC